MLYIWRELGKRDGTKTTKISRGETSGPAVVLSDLRDSSREQRRNVVLTVHRTAWSRSLHSSCNRASEAERTSHPMDRTTAKLLSSRTEDVTGLRHVDNLTDERQMPMEPDFCHQTRPSETNLKLWSRCQRQDLLPRLCLFQRRKNLPVALSHRPSNNSGSESHLKVNLTRSISGHLRKPSRSTHAHTAVVERLTRHHWRQTSPSKTWSRLRYPRERSDRKPAESRTVATWLIRRRRRAVE